MFIFIYFLLFALLLYNMGRRERLPKKQVSGFGWFLKQKQIPTASTRIKTKGSFVDFFGSRHWIMMMMMMMMTVFTSPMQIELSNCVTNTVVLLTLHVDLGIGVRFHLSPFHPQFLANHLPP
ncbi:hypothetical protein VTH06DRAFT_2073 [Thermothelomyces fergusii]